MFAGLDPVSSGPWKFQSWQKGVQITVVKNPRYTVAPDEARPGRLPLHPDTNARFQAMKAGEGQAIEPQAQLQIADFLKDPNFVVKRCRRVLVRAPRHPVRPEGCSRR